MQVVQKACFYILFIVMTTISLHAILPSIMISQDSSDQDHVEKMKESLQSFTLEPIEFPVQKSKTDTTNFIRKGILAIRPEAIATVIVCHGFTQSKTETAFFRTFFPRCNVIAFDFRAHGELIDGQYSTIGNDEMYDVKGAVDFVKAHPELQNKPIVGFGFSMGAVTLIQAQAEFSNLFDAIIMDSPFDSSSDCMAACLDKMLTVKLFGQKYRIPGRNVMLKCFYCQRLQPIMRKVFCYVVGFKDLSARTQFQPVLPIDNAPKITIPCFFITCENDKKVPVNCVQRLYNSVSSCYKRLWISHGARHCASCLESPELYAYRVNKFIKNALNKSWKEAEKIHDDRQDHTTKDEVVK